MVSRAFLDCLPTIPSGSLTAASGVATECELSADIDRAAVALTSHQHIDNSWVTQYSDAFRRSPILEPPTQQNSVEEFVAGSVPS